MAPPLILRIITDATQTLKANDAVIASNTAVGRSALALGGDYEKSAAARVASSTKAIQAQRAELAALERIAATSKATGDERIAINNAVAASQARLNSVTGVGAAESYAAAGTAAKTAENDIGKLTRGALAGSGVFAALGRSLAFASTGFIAVAGGSTLIASSIRQAEAQAAAQRGVERQLETSGKTFGEYRGQIEKTINSESRLAGFTRTELLQAFGYLVRVGGNVSKSLDLTSLAADIARARQISLASASIALAKALGGSATALRRLGIIVPKNVSTTAALTYVQQKFAGQAAASTTASEKLGASLSNAGATIGTALLPTFDRLATRFGNWISNLDKSGRLSRDATSFVHGLGDAFHFLGGIIGIADRVTGSFGNTIKLIIGLELAKHITSWIGDVALLAKKWGLVADSATVAAAAEAKAVGVGGAAGVVGAAGAGTAVAGVEGLAAGGLAGRIAPYTMGGRTGAFMASIGTAEASAPAVVGTFSKMATLFGRLIPEIGIVLVLLNSKVQASLGSLLKDVSNIRPGDLKRNGIYGSIGGDLLRTDQSILGALPFGSGKFIGQATGITAISDFFVGTPEQQARARKQKEEFLAAQQLIIDQLKHAAATIPTQFLPGGKLGRAVQPGSFPSTVGPFLGATQTRIRTSYAVPLYLQVAQAQAGMTASIKDDVAIAVRIIKNIKRIIASGNYDEKGLLDLLNAQSAAQSVIQSAQAAAAAKAAAAAAKAKQIASSFNVPGYLQVAQAKLEAEGKDTTAILKKIIAAAYAAIHSGKKNWQGILAAYQTIISAQSQLASQAQAFVLPLRLQLQLARAQATNANTTPILLKMRAALYRALKAAKGNIQKQIDIWNQIAGINQQLQNSVTNAYGNYKKASLAALTANLGLTRAQRQALEAKLSQRGPGGTVPGSGTGAGGYIIDPDTGRPVRVGHRHHAGGGGGRARVPATAGGGVIRADFTINLIVDGKKMAAVVTRHQQRYRSSNPSSRRGPHAATATS